MPNAGPQAADRGDAREVPNVRVRPVRDLDEAAAAGELLRTAYKDAGRGNPSYLEHLRDVGPRMTSAELLVAVDRSGTILGSVTYVRPGTQYALVSRENEGELRMLGVVEHRDKKLIEEMLIRACVDRAGRDGYDALVMTALKRHARRPGRTYVRAGFRLVKGREISPAPGLHLVVFTLPVPAS